MPLSAGILAPDFSLQDETGVLRRLSDYRGMPVVLYFYPKDDTPGCTREACNFRDDFRDRISACKTKPASCAASPIIEACRWCCIFIPKTTRPAARGKRATSGTTSEIGFQPARRNRRPAPPLRLSRHAGGAVFLSQRRHARLHEGSVQLPGRLQRSDFSLQDETGVLRRLSDYRGMPVVLYFYPKDDTPGCTREACNFRDDFSAYQEAGITILGVSPDSPKSHAKFKV